MGSFFKDNIILFFSSLVFSIFAYFFQFYMGRALGPIDYGILSSLFSLIYLMTVVVYIIQTSISNFVTRFKVRKEKEKINFLLRKATSKLVIVAVLAVILFLLVSPMLQSFLKIESFTPFILLSLVLAASLLLPIQRGALQGLQNFKALGVNYIFDGFCRLSFGVLLVYLGFGVSGAVGAIAIAYTFAYLEGFTPLKKYYKKVKTKFNIKKFGKFMFPVSVSLILLTLMYTMDVILVRHYLPEVEAGYYAAIVLFGRMLLFAIIPICTVLFPKVTQRHEEKRPHLDLLLKTLGLILLVAVPAVIIFFLFSEQIVQILLGTTYISIAPYIGWFALTMLFFSLVYALAHYFLSLQKTGFIPVLALFTVVEIIAIVLWHSSIMQIIQILLILFSIQFIILFIMALFASKAEY